jgi:hypothetical protein
MESRLRIAGWPIVWCLISVSWLVAPGSFAQEQAPDPTPECEWIRGDEIVVTITTPSQDGWTLWVSESMPVAAQAYDLDYYSDDDGAHWYAYWDDVMSGTTADTYHIIWSATAGSFTEIYGPSSTYVARPYDAGPLARDVTITATATDANRPGDVLGAPDGEGGQPATKAATRPGQDFRLEITISQAGQVGDQDHPALDPPPQGGIPADAGGGKLGWLVPNTPQGCTDYAGASYFRVTAAVGKDPEGGIWLDADKMGIREVFSE